MEFGILPSILSGCVGVFGFLWLQKYSGNYTHVDIEKFGQKYIINHPQYNNEKWIKHLENDKKIGFPSAPLDTQYEDVFLKSRNRNKTIGKICIIIGLTITPITAVLTLI